MQRRLVLPLSASLEVWRVQNCRRSCEGLRTVHLYSCKPKGVNTTTSLGDIPSRDMIGPPCPHVAKGTNQDHTGGGGGGGMPQFQINPPSILKRPPGERTKVKVLGQ